MAQVRTENTFKLAYPNTTCHIKCYYVHFILGSAERQEGINVLYKHSVFFSNQRYVCAPCWRAVRSPEAGPTAGRGAVLVLRSGQAN